MPDYTLTFTDDESTILQGIFNTDGAGVEAAIQNYIGNMVEAEENRLLEEEFASKSLAEKKVIMGS